MSTSPIAVLGRCTRFSGEARPAACRRPGAVRVRATAQDPLPAPTASSAHSPSAPSGRSASPRGQSLGELARHRSPLVGLDPRSRWCQSNRVVAASVDPTRSATPQGRHLILPRLESPPRRWSEQWSGWSSLRIPLQPGLLGRTWGSRRSLQGREFGRRRAIPSTPRRTHARRSHRGHGWRP